MKILALSHSCVTDVNQQLFVALRRLPDVEIELIVPSAWKSEYGNEVLKPRLLPEVDFPVHTLPVAISGNPSLHFYKRFPLARLRRFRPDIVLSMQEPWSLSNLQALCLSRILRVPLVFQAGQNLFKRYPPPFNWIEQLAQRSAAAGLAYTEEVRQVLLRKGMRRPTIVVPHGTNLSLFHPGRSMELRQKLGLGQSVVLGYMGRFVPEKGLDTLVEAVALLRRDAPELDVRVLLIGSGPQEEALKQQAARAGVEAQFHFPGPVPHRQAGEYMNCFDVFVLPSLTTPRWKEQFGRVIIESLACEVPVAGSDSGEIPRLIESTGGGLVFREGDPQDMAETLARLIRDPELRAALGRAGGDAVRRRYTYEAVAGQMRDVLQTALHPAG